MSEQNEHHVSRFKVRFWQRHFRTMRALSIFCVFYIGVGVYMTTQQERFIYLPPATTPACEELLRAEKSIIGDTRLYVHEHEERMVILYHGNAGTVCDRAHYAEIFREAGWGYVLVGYSGFGDGTRHPTHERIRRDVHNVIQFLEERNLKHVFIVGESIGAGVASYHTSIAPPDALFLVTPFDTLRSVAQHHYWYFPVNWFLQEAYDNIAALHYYDSYVVIMHGTNDEIIPLYMAEHLYNNLKTTEKNFVVLDGAGHNTIWWYKEAEEALQSFLSE